MQNIELLMEILGWAGALAVLAAYFLLSANKVENSSLMYQLLNLFGAIFLIVNTMYKQAFPSAFVNVIWVFIAGYSIYKYHIKKN